MQERNIFICYVDSFQILTQQISSKLDYFFFFLLIFFVFFMYFFKTLLHLYFFMNFETEAFISFVKIISLKAITEINYNNAYFLFFLQISFFIFFRIILFSKYSLKNTNFIIFQISVIKPQANYLGFKIKFGF